MTWLRTLRTAVLGIAANRLRSALTTLGIIIGTASVITVLALGNGARAAVENSFRYLGADTIQINQRQEYSDGSMKPTGQPLTYEDGLLMADEVPMVERVEMQVGGHGKVRFGRKVLDMSIIGVTADVLETLIADATVQPVGWPEGKPLSPEAYLSQGRFFTPAEVLSGAEICVLGYQTALDLFEGDNPLDQTVHINRQRCLVVGVLSELEAVDAEERYKSQPNQGFYLPISTAINMLHQDQPSVYITARVSDESKIDLAKAQVVEFLRKRHAIEPDAEGKYADDFDLMTRKDILGARQESAKTFSILLIAMAVVSLVVGGIGIMNVMLVNVTERTREIGIRQAVGARQRDILRQFLVEAVLLSAVGGLFGVAAGILSIPLAAQLNQGVALLAPVSIPVSFALAMITGVVFGLYPAMRAARMEPVNALRYE